MKNFLGNLAACLIVAVWLAVVIVVTFGPLYIAWHFISKFW